VTITNNYRWTPFSGSDNLLTGPAFQGATTTVGQAFWQRAAWRHQISHGRHSRRFASNTERQVTINTPSSAYNNLFSISFVSRFLASERLILVLFGISSYLAASSVISFFSFFDSSWLEPWSRYSALHLQLGGSNTGGYLFWFLFLFFPQEETQQCTFSRQRPRQNLGFSNSLFSFPSSFLLFGEGKSGIKRLS
jgi:hypothetical protein